MELRHIFPFVHDCVPCVVWRVDRVDVGLHTRQLIHLRTVLLTYNDHWKFSGEYSCALDGYSSLEVFPFQNELSNFGKRVFSSH